MYLDSIMNVERGWPNGGSRERAELIEAGSVLQAGDVVSMTPSGCVAKVGSTASNAVGLVIRGNYDSASAANANGVYMTPQPAKVVTGMTWSGGLVTVTVTAHGYAVGQAVTIAGATYTGTSANGNQVIVGITDANNFTFALATTCGTATVTNATSTLISTYSPSGKATVLWGNYIVATQNYAAGAYVPGSLVTGKSGQFALAGAFSQSGTTPFAVTQADPACGFVIRVQGAVTGIANTGQTAHLVISAF